ncbi:hypothetical protein TNCV_285881 [Trichonephila clavipes]|nr:hypothetical protein TNCV_285881 [Trichonephila clavipes]
MILKSRQIAFWNISQQIYVDVALTLITLLLTTRVPTNIYSSGKFGESTNTTVNSPSGIVVSDADFGVIGLGPNPGEGMDVCKCIIASWHGDTLNSHRAASPLVRLKEGEEMWEEPQTTSGCSPSNLGWNQANLYCHFHGDQN